MKLIPKSTVARCLWVGAILLLIALGGPSLIQPGLCSKISKRRGMFLDLAEDGVHPGALLAG
jgi:hypothetical protein